MMLEPGDMVFNKLEKEVQLVIEVEPSHAFSSNYTEEALTMAFDGALLWYPARFLVDPPNKAGEGL